MIILLDLKVCDKATGIKTVSHWHKHRHVDLVVLNLWVKASWGGGVIAQISCISDIYHCDSNSSKINVMK